MLSAVTIWLMPMQPSLTPSAARLCSPLWSSAAPIWLMPMQPVLDISTAHLPHAHTAPAEYQQHPSGSCPCSPSWTSVMPTQPLLTASSTDLAHAYAASMEPAVAAVAADPAVLQFQVFPIHLSAGSAVAVCIIISLGCPVCRQVGHLEAQPDDLMSVYAPLTGSRLAACMAASPCSSLCKQQENSQRLACCVHIPQAAQQLPAFVRAWAARSAGTSDLGVWQALRYWAQGVSALPACAALSAGTRNRPSLARHQIPVKPSRQDSCTGASACPLVPHAMQPGNCCASQEPVQSFKALRVRIYCSGRSWRSNSTLMSGRAVQ